jgi:dephospho-CoA kinase
MPFVIGLTGSVGMGKTTTAAMFAAQGIPVWDADAAVHRLYAPGGAAVEKLAAMFPEAVAGGAVSRAALRRIIKDDPGALAEIERVVHPLVAVDRERFLADVTGDIAVLDMPLLFETGAQKIVDATVVVSAPEEVQRARVLARPGMTERELAIILGRQMPDSRKRSLADHVIDTTSPASAAAGVEAVLADVAARLREGRHTAGMAQRGITAP